MDAEGDRQRASRSLALVYGRQTALHLSSALFGLVVIRTLLRSQTPAAGRRAMRGPSLSGSLGLLAFRIGSWVAR